MRKFSNLHQLTSTLEQKQQHGVTLPVYTPLRQFSLYTPLSINLVHCLVASFTIRCTVHETAGQLSLA